MPIHIRVRRAGGEKRECSQQEEKPGKETALFLTRRSRGCPKPKGFRYLFFCFFHLAQRARCAAAMRSRAAGLSFPRPLLVTADFLAVLAGAVAALALLAFAQRARWAAAMRARPAAESLRFPPREVFETKPAEGEIRGDTDAPLRSRMEASSAWSFSIFSLSVMARRRVAGEGKFAMAILGACQGLTTNVKQNFASRKGRETAETRFRLHSEVFF